MGEELVFALFGQPMRVLDHVAVHVGDPEGAVGAGAGHDGAAPAVGAGEEVGLFFGAEAGGFEGDAVIGEDEGLDEVVERFADEGGGLAGGEEQGVLVDHAAAGGGVAAGLLEVVVAFLRRAGGINGRIRAAGELDAAVAGGEVGVAAEVVLGEDVVPEGVGVLRAEPVAPVVAIAAELGGAALGFDVAGVGSDPKVAAADEGFFAGAGGLQFRIGAVFAVVTAGGDVDPVVEAPAQAVGAELLVALGEAGVEDFFLVGFAVAVGVTEEEDVGGGGDDDAVAPGDEAVGKVQAFGKEGAVVVGAVGVAVFEDSDAAAAGAGVAEAERVVGHFDDPEAALGVPVEGDGVEDEGFGSDDLGFETGREAEGFEGIGGGERGGGGLGFGGGTFRGGEVSADLVGGEGGGVEGGFVEFAFEGEEVVAAAAEEDFGGVVGQGPLGFGFDLFLAVEIHGEFFVFADEHDVMPVAVGESGFAGDDLADVVAGVEEEVASRNIGVGAADAEVLAEGAFVAVEPSGEQVGGDGAGVGG